MISITQRTVRTVLVSFHSQAANDILRRMPEQFNLVEVQKRLDAIVRIIALPEVKSCLPEGDPPQKLNRRCFLRSSHLHP